MKIIGIDPGLATVGWGIVEVNNRRLSCVDFGIITTSHETPKPQRLSAIAHSLTHLLETHKPDVVVIEELFFAKNRKTALMVAEARGVILASVSACPEITEITPLQVKQFIAFSGRAPKQKVGEMVQRLLRLETIPKPDDAADALAIALCGAVAKNKIVW